MAFNNANNPTTLIVSLGVGSSPFPVFQVPRKFHLTNVTLLSSTAIAADPTNYLTLSVLSGATPVATLDTRATAQGAVTAMTGKAFALTGEWVVLVSGSNITLTATAAGAATIPTNARVAITGHYV